MITSAICIVKGMRSQNPRPQESTTSRTVDGVAAKAATNTTTVAISAKTNASGTHRSVQSVSASAIRAIGPVVSKTTGLSSTIVLGSVRSHPLRVERELLHAPVVHVGDVQIVFSRARDGVNPVELLHLMARLAHSPEDLAVQRHLVNTPRLIV